MSWCMQTFSYVSKEGKIGNKNNYRNITFFIFYYGHNDVSQLTLMHSSKN